MSLEDNDTSNLPKLTPISSNQHVKQAVQNSTMRTVDSSADKSLKTLIEQQADMPLNIDKLIDTFCGQLTNLISILIHKVNVEQTSRGSRMISPKKQSLVVKTRQKETRKKSHHEVSSSEDADDSDGNHTSTHKGPRVNSHHRCVQLSKPEHRDDDKVSILDGEEMNRNTKAHQWESDNSNSGKD